jgi:N-hydroxyarylamine O-acetyltransferase
MPDDVFDLEAWLRRIGYDGPREPTLAGLRAVIAAQSGTIPFENVDVLLGRVPRLDIESLQRKLVDGGRGGYCFELNSLMRTGLRALGFSVTSLLARVIVGLDHDEARPATHMVLRVDLPEGPFLADAGFGNLTATAPLDLRSALEQTTPHETMHLLPVGEDLVLRAKLGADWQNIYRLSPHPALPIDYEVANWFTATHPGSPFVSNLIASRPGTGGVRNTLFNGRLSVRRPPNQVDRRMLEDEAAVRNALAANFGLTLPDGDLAAALAVLDRVGTRGAAHPFFN